MVEDSTPAVIRHLLNLDGSCFVDLKQLSRALDRLSSDERGRYRNENASVIATCDAERLLVVAGPGAGKSHLFLARIKHWLPLHVGQRVYVATFVRKLVTDLRDEIRAKMPETDQQRVDVSTLHTLARSVVERGGGTVAHPMRQHVRIIDSFWAEVTWEDVLLFDPGLNVGGFLVREMEDQYHRNQMEPSVQWTRLVNTYRRLCQFYNAVGFAYLIAFAVEVVTQKPDVIEHQLWIIDEYQDFNPTEDALIRGLTERSLGVVLAGDDEQALYQELKSATPDIIIGYYNDRRFAKAMLPYCSRCGYHICRVASAFIARHRDSAAVEKIYLPLTLEAGGPKVQIVGTAEPTGAIDYVRQFLIDKTDAYTSYLRDREDGRISDPFLLILSQSGALTNSKVSPADESLYALVDEYNHMAAKRSADYMRVVAYYSAALNPDDNFAVRKVLLYENLRSEDVHGLILEAIGRPATLWRMVSELHPEVVERLREVGALIERSAADPVAAASDLSHLLGFSNASALAMELMEHPIGHDASEQEDQEAIATAGLVPPIALMTMVGSKGLSALHVIILGCDDMNMGYTSPLTFFVALTRARQSLHLVASRKTGGSTQPHAYLYDLPSASCDYVNYKKTGHVSKALAGPGALRKMFETLAWVESRPKKKIGQKPQRKLA